MKTTIIIIMLLALASPAVAATSDSKANSAKLEFTIEPTKAVFGENEAITVRFRVRNLTSQKVLVAKIFPLTQFVDLDVVDAQGKHVQWCGRVSQQIYSRESYKVLNPHESNVATSVVSCTDKGDPSRAWGYSFDHRGRYVIRGRYHLPEPTIVYRKMFPNIVIICGPISAPPVTIELK